MSFVNEGGWMILKICASEWAYASRDKRELSACRELGEEVLVLAKGNLSDKGRLDEVDGYQVRRFTTRPMGLRVPNWINRVASLFVWARYTKNELKPQIISGHDLAGLLIGWLSNIGRKDKAKLIYDSHEFELGRYTGRTKRNKLQMFYIKHLERFLMKRCAFSIMVNDSIADEVQRIHKLEQRPIVVRSTPEKWKIDKEAIRQVRAELTSQFHAEGTILMRHGMIGTGCGIEKLLEVVKCMQGVNAVILGYGAEPYISSLKKLAEEFGITERVLFHPAVPITELWKYAGAADVGMSIAPAVSMSYYYALPNKLFENIQSETPVIVSNIPEMKKIVKQYGIGLLCDPKNTAEICACVEKMRTDKAFYEQCKKNTLAAKEDLCWENEKEVLKSAYKRILS